MYVEQGCRDTSERSTGPARDHPVSADDGTTYATDELGNLTGIDAPGTSSDWTFAYDAWSQLRTATQGSTVINYALDALGRLLTRTNGSASTSYLYRGTSEDISKATPSTGSATTYTYSAGGPLAQKIGTTKRLYLRDVHGDVVGLTDTAGVAKGTRTFDPYGRQRTSTGETSVLGFQGAPTDTNTGLVDMVTRHYLPTLGRFITADQVFGNLMLPISLNRFSYAVGNPVSYTDPDGMCADPSFCPAPITSSRSSAERWYDTGSELNEPSYGESSGYHSYVTKLYVEHPDIRPPTFRLQFFNRLPNLLRDRGLLDTDYATFGCSGTKGFSSCGVHVEDEGGGFMGFLHNTLDLIGFIPVVGEPADGANAVLYAIEGDHLNALIYAGAVLIPTSGRALRAGREIVEEGVEVVAKNADGLLTRARYAIGDLRDETGIVGRGSRLTNAQATDMANWIGFRPAGGSPIQGQRVFTNGRRYIVQDITSNKPEGLWKMAKTPARSAQQADEDGHL